MIETIEKSVKNYLTSIGGDFNRCDKKDIKGYVGKISIKGEREADIYVVMPKEKLDLVSEYLFGDRDYEVDDLVKEIANLIAGNAKVIGSKKNLNFDISLPEFLGEYKGFLEFDEVLAFNYRGKCFYILFKEK